MFSEVSDKYCLFNYYGRLLKDQILPPGNEMPPTRSDAKKLLNYNLPPWLAIKKGHLLLSLIVRGKYKVKNMDV